VVGFSPAMEAVDRAVKDHLRRHVYRQADVLAVMERAEKVVADLFAHYRAEPTALPEGWRQAEGDKARIVADFLAGMTDRYALQEHQRFFGGGTELR
jgi:dGTPase